MLEHQMKENLDINDSVGVLQLNCKHSKYVTYSLFNSTLTSLFSILSLQEPYVNPMDNFPLNQSNWTLVCPTPRSLKEEDRPRACLYIRQDLDPIINPIFSPLRNLAASTITIRDYTVLLASVYNPQKTLDGFEAFIEMLQSAPLSTQLLPTICITDANLHSPLWNPRHIAQSYKTAETLIEMLTEWGLHLRSPRGVPTFGVRSENTEGTSIDQVWVDKDLDDTLITCFIDKDNIVNHQSDHQALVTIFSTKTADGLAPNSSQRQRILGIR